jgi:hypothetical protein
MGNDMISPRTERVLKRCLSEFESKLDIETEDNGAGTEAQVREFGMEPDEMAYIVAAICQFFLVNRIDMMQGVALAIMIGMMMGREFDSELRTELDEQLGGLGS